MSSRPFSGSASEPSAELTFASGLFHGSEPGMASRVTSTVIVDPWVAPGAPFGRRYSAPPCAIATAFLPLVPVLSTRAAITLPAGTEPSNWKRASMISPESTSAARVSPMPRSMSHSGNRISRGLQQDACLGNRQSDHVRIAAGDVAHIDFAIALQSIAPGLAAPFAMAGIIVDLYI